MIHPDQRGEDAPANRPAAAAFLAALLPALLAALAACGTAPSRVAAPDRAAAPIAHDADDASYDWHGLLVAPFGSALKDIPLKFHEVLLFRDSAHSPTAADDAECYAADSGAPRFIGRTPNEYLLCFRQDRLSRVQASVDLPAEQAPDTFAAACGRWLKSAVPDEAGCAGRDGAIRFSGRLEDKTLSVTLDSVADP
jgi:hypothetical protein